MTHLWGFFVFVDDAFQNASSWWTLITQPVILFVFFFRCWLICGSYLAVTKCSCLSRQTWSERARLGGKYTHTLQLAGLIHVGVSPQHFSFPVFSLCLNPLGHTKVDESETNIHSHTFLNDLIRSFIHADVPLYPLLFSHQTRAFSLNSSCCFRAKNKQVSNFLYTSAHFNSCKFRNK